MGDSEREGIELEHGASTGRLEGLLGNRFTAVLGIVTWPIYGLLRIRKSVGRGIAWV
jgi:hypothetical protein